MTQEQAQQVEREDSCYIEPSVIVADDEGGYRLEKVESFLPEAAKLTVEMHLVVQEDSEQDEEAEIVVFAPDDDGDELLLTGLLGQLAGNPRVHCAPTSALGYYYQGKHLSLTRGFKVLVPFSICAVLAGSIERQAAEEGIAVAVRKVILAESGNLLNQHTSIEVETFRTISQDKLLNIIFYGLVDDEEEWEDEEPSTPEPPELPFAKLPSPVQFEVQARCHGDWHIRIVANQEELETPLETLGRTIHNMGNGMLVDCDRNNDYCGGRATVEILAHGWEIGDIAETIATHLEASYRVQRYVPCQYDLCEDSDLGGYVLAKTDSFLDEDWHLIRHSELSTHF